MANTTDPMNFLLDYVSDDAIALTALLSRHVDTGTGCSCDSAVPSGIAHRLHVATALLAAGVTLPVLLDAIAVTR